MATDKVSPKQQTLYINNPFVIAVEGMKLLFQKAPTLAIILAILSAFGASNVFSNQTEVADNTAPIVATPDLDPVVVAGTIIIIAVMLFGILIFGSIIAGIFAFTSAEIAKGRTVSFRQAAKAIVDRLWSFVWLQLLTIAKIFAWSLLLIIPGIVMAIRYSLANISFFDSDKKLTGNAAIKDSLALTKDAWVTTFGAQVFFNIITLGLISPLLDTASKAVLYRQFTALQRSGEAKPKPHALSWVVFGLFIAVIFAGLAGLTYGIIYDILPRMQ
ncbi:MAG: hypothetical protein ABWX90_01930 [Candidatus Saccharimonadales bacterium]